MTYFKLNIPKVNESITRYKDTKNNCLEDIGIVYRGLGYTESAWNDPNAYTFIEKTKRDKYKINEYLGYLDSLYNEINQFKLNIDDLCSKHGYRRNSVTLKFDDSDIDACKRYLNNAITLLNDSLNKINISAFKPDFEYINLLYNLRSEIKSIRNSTNQLIQDINNFTNSVNNEIYNSKFRLKRIGNFDLNLKPSDYNWKVVEFAENTIDKGQYESYSGVSLNKIDNNTQDSKLSNTIPSYNSTITNITTEEVQRVAGLNNNLNNTSANQNDIVLDETKKVEGLNNNLNTTYSNQNSIDLETSKRVDGLNQNLNTVSTKDIDVNIDNIGKINGLNDNIDNKNVNSAEIQFDTTKNIKDLNTNAYETKTNNVDMNFNVNNNVNVSNNISSAKANQTNIDTSNIISNNYDLSSGINIAEVNSSGINSNISKNVNLDTNINKMESLNDLDSK